MTDSTRIAINLDRAQLRRAVGVAAAPLAAIVADVAAADPFDYFEADERGECHFCGTDFALNAPRESHGADCEWRRATEWVSVRSEGYDR